MKRKQIAIGLIAVLVLGAGGWFVWSRRTKSAATDVTYVQQPVKRQTLKVTVSGTGPAAATNAVVMKTTQSGNVTQVLVQDGDQVKAGQVLFTMENEQVVTALQQAEADLASAIENLNQKLRPTDTTVRAQQNKVESAELTLKQREEERAGLHLTAPAAGVITSIATAVGSDVQANAQLLAIYDDQTPSFLAQVPQDAAVGLKPGAEADVTIPGFGTRFGTVRSLVGNGQGGTGGKATVSVAIDLPATEGLRPGMSGTVQIKTTDLTFQVTGSGTVQDDSIQVRSMTAGEVAQIVATEGARVTAGDLLITLTNPQVELGYKQATNDLATQRENLTALITPQSDPDGSIRQLQAKVATAQRTLDEKKTAVDDLSVKAPIDGKLSGFAIKVGDKIDAKAQVGKVADYGAMEMKISVDELDIAKMQAGQPVAITFDALPGKKYEGKVAKVALEGTVKNDIATFDVTVQIGNPTGILAGMNGSAEIAIAQRENVLTVPAQAVRTVAGKTTVQILQDTKPVPVEVQVGLRTTTDVEILSGLTEGQQVITTTVRAQSGLAIPGLGGGQNRQQGNLPGGNNANNRNQAGGRN